MLIVVVGLSHRTAPVEVREKLSIPDQSITASLKALKAFSDVLLFDGVKFERDCVRTSSLVISTLDSTARFTNTVHIKDGAKSISL